MIITSYAGAGKTFFANHAENAVDLVTMPHSWILPPPGKNPGEHESEKGARYLLRDPRYPDNYILEILKAEREYRYVLIPTNAGILRQLRETYGRNAILCYPTPEQKSDYRERFLARGNSSDFLDIFIDNFEEFLSPFWNREVPGYHLPLLPGEFLLDKKETIDRITSEDTSELISDSVIEKLTKEQVRGRGGFVLYLSGDCESLLYCIQNIDCAEERSFLYRIGRKVYDETEIIPLVVPRRYFEEICFRFLWTDDKSKVYRFVEHYKTAGRRWSGLKRW